MVLKAVFLGYQDYGKTSPAKYLQLINKTEHHFFAHYVSSLWFCKCAKLSVLPFQHY